MAKGHHSKGDAIKGGKGHHARRKHYNLSNNFTNSFNLTKSGNITFIDASNLLYYIYEMPPEFSWRWPKNGTDCVDSGYLSHEHAELAGYGRPILPENGLFLTWHFSLFNSLFNRMKRSRRRTLDPEKASLFLLPYDLGLDGFMNPDTCATRRSCTPRLVKELEKTLRESPFFQRHAGADHAVLWSLGHYHPWPRSCDTFMKHTCTRCTYTCYWMDPTIPNNNFVSVPFPSGYHWWDGVRHVPWEARPSERNRTAVYLGSIKTLNPAHTKIRRAMTQQCNASEDCTWWQIGHSSVDASIADYLSLYKQSVFCLCPPGDDPARKAVFDALLSGCIPVIFEVATLFNQYPWHIGEDMALDIAVNIPGGQVRSGKLQFMPFLLSIPAEVVRSKQTAIRAIAPRLQYAMPPLHLLLNDSDPTVWDPPFRDGVDVTLDGMFNRAFHSVRKELSGIPKRTMKTAEWGKEYDRLIARKPRNTIQYA
eukprot:CAMPEP_0182436832 /NCGR_PEP_ID=MMETSP1167-20130531/83858_1 /TAXON_ID=2988 /ORGANISM="Mallomonas Sp, Strain CCMP3275" /LENGTH=478 /DNA_ID=CAMNT_0024629421 /DNA_START=97 /DNA_END=1533 /DNA_ORIENTATION=-